MKSVKKPSKTKRPQSCDAQRIVHPDNPPLTDDSVHFLADFRKWLNNQIDCYKNATKNLGMSVIGRQILAAKEPFHGTAAMLRKAFEFADRFNVDSRTLLQFHPVSDDANITADEAASCLEKILVTTGAYVAKPAGAAPAPVGQRILITLAAKQMDIDPSTLRKKLRHLRVQSYRSTARSNAFDVNVGELLKALSPFAEWNDRLTSLRQANPAAV